MTNKQTIKPISELYLDPENPRLSQKSLGEKEIIQHLFDKEDVVNIIKRFSKFGYLPNESLIVVKRCNKNIVVEGNRRLCALKLINQPSLIPDHKRTITALAKDANKAELLDVPIYIVEKQMADTIRINRHTTNFVKKWDRVNQANFYRDFLDQGYTIDDISEKHGINKSEIESFLKMEQWYLLSQKLPLDDKTKEIVNNEKKFNSSALERIVDTKGVNEFLGIDFDENIKIKGKISKEEFAKGFQKIVYDIAHKKITTRTHNKAEDIHAYLSKFKSSERPDTRKRGHFDVDSFSSELSRTNDNTSSSRKPRQHSYIIPKDIDFQLKSESLKGIFTELKNKMPVNSCPNAVAIVFRSFLEMSIYKYLEEKKLIEELKLDKSRSTLKPLLQYISDNHNKCGVSKKAAEAARKSLTGGRDLIFSLSTMNAISHNENFAVTGEDVRKIWQNYEALVRDILKGVNDK